MALPIPTGELLGQQITINCTEQEDDFYMGQSIVDLSTEYDLTKGVDITFDGQLYKNVPIEFISDEGAFMIGEAGGHSPLFDKYPFVILLGLDTPLEISIHIAGLELYVKTQGERTFVVTEVSSSERVMKLSGASRTYSHTAEPRFVKKADKTNELPEITSADAGKVFGVDEEGKITLVEDGGSAEENAKSVTYSELVALKTAGELVPGTWYRITDYVTKINGTYDLSAMGAMGYLHYAVSAEHPFDLIVLATGEDELNENAYAALHDGDTYFVNSALGAWKIKYTIENDPTKYAWADSTNGKGVIFELEDEFGNRCGYDFKSIMFPRYALKLADATVDFTPADTGLVYDASTNPCRYGSVMQIFAALRSYRRTETYVNPWVQTNGYENGQAVKVNNYDFSVGANILGVVTFPAIDTSYLAAFDCDLYYTFDYWDGAAHKDYSLNSNGVMVCSNNIIEGTRDMLAVQLELSIIPAGLNGSVFEEYDFDNGALSANLDNVLKEATWENTFGHSAWGNSLGNACNANTFGDNCHANTFGDNCHANTFGGYCYSNTFGDNCHANTFGGYCSGNTFGGYCNANTFGNDCYDNTFGNECDGNMFGGYCYSNTFWSYCYSNTFGNDCYDNTFGDNCHANTFGNECDGNMFGNECDGNMFGNECDGNTLRGYCSGNTLVGYICNITVGERVHYVDISGGASGTLVRYYHICDRVQGTVNSRISIVGTPNLGYETWVGYNSTYVLKTWCPADLAT